jgi:hypothetical protein
MAMLYVEGVTLPPVLVGIGRAEDPTLIEPVFVMPSCQHERLFGVKKFFERMFAFTPPRGYLLPNRCSPSFGPRTAG